MKKNDSRYVYDKVENEIKELIQSARQKKGNPYLMN